MSLQSIADWFYVLGAAYGVNPLIFGAIYVGAMPFFALSVTWIVRNLRKGQSLILPQFSTSFCLVSAYLYLTIAGHNIPAWVYVFVALMIGLGIFSTVQKVRKQLKGA